MPIYLKHERHGTKVACSEIEAQYDETHGWVRFELDKPEPVKSEPVNLSEQRQKRAYNRRVA